VALTGTDLYRDFPRSPSVLRSLQAASLILMLQPKALNALPAIFRGKARLIYQSAALSRRQPPSPPEKARSAGNSFDVCVIGNLRAVKDPFRTALAVRNLPSSSRIRIIHIGAALTDADEKRALAEMKRNPRYRWLGVQSHSKVRRVLRRSAACVLSSKAEGGANVISEAVAEGVPVLASRIPGSVGILGEDYPGYFSAGDTEGLRKLLIRAETDQEFLQRLRARCCLLASLFDPARETAAWKKLLRELKTAITKNTK
jgi:putative glycosyltransferase (TIGR04348 family)